MVHLSSWQRRFAAHLLLHRHSSALGGGPLTASAEIRTRVTIHRVGQRVSRRLLSDGRALACARSLCLVERIDGSSFLFFQRHGRKKEKKVSRARETHGHPLSRSTTTIRTIGIITEEARTPPRDIYIYVCACVYVCILVLSRCSLFHPRRNVEFERITETRRWGKSEHNIHPSLLRFVLLAPSSRHVLKPKSLFYFKLRTCLVRRILYLFLLLASASQSYARTHAPSDIHTLTRVRTAHKRPRSPALYTVFARERFLASRYPLTTSPSICLLCKSRLTGADGDNDNGAIAPNRQLRVDGYDISR